MNWLWKKVKWRIQKDNKFLKLLFDYYWLEYFKMIPWKFHRKSETFGHIQEKETSLLQPSQLLLQNH